MGQELEKENQEELEDVEIADLANKEIRSRDAEIAKLKKDLAKAKLYSTAEEEKETSLTSEECVEIIFDSRTTNYDYIDAMVKLSENEIAEGKPDRLGEDVRSFLKNVLEECGDDKSRFTSIYQARLGADDPSIAMAYKKRKL